MAKIIFCDMDGVLVDFVSGACVVHNRAYNAEKAAGVYDLHTVWGLSKDDFWEPLRSRAFWAELGWMPDGQLILEGLEALVGPENVFLATTPVHGAECIVGKYDWIKSNLPHYQRRFMVCGSKHGLAHYNSVLVDDHEKNCADFWDRGAGAVLVPRNWNSQHMWSTRPDLVEMVLEEAEAGGPRPRRRLVCYSCARDVTDSSGVDYIDRRTGVIVRLCMDCYRKNDCAFRLGALTIH